VPSLPHYGYQPGERPDYQPCPSCGEIVRADRLDLIDEHRRQKHPKMADEIDLDKIREKYDWFKPGGHQPAEPTPNQRRPRLFGHELTKVEIDILQGLAEGDKTSDIARHRGTSRFTVERQINMILAKLGARRRAQAVAIAIRRGLIN
jgi:DNA-binding NarL/FixJ family response regulator